MAIYAAAWAAPLPDPVYYPNEKLANVIVHAWTDSTYRGTLLTFGEGPFTRSSRPTNSDYARTARALSDHDIHISRPVVLTPQQYAIGYIKVEDEVVFVLPDPIAEKGRFTLPSADVAMRVTPLGM
jgi:hypothetical protein